MNFYDFKLRDVVELITFIGNTIVVVTTRELSNELCNENRFIKAVGGGLRQVRNGVGDGLFTVSYLRYLQFILLTMVRLFHTRKIGL